MTEVTKALASFVARTRYADIPPSVLEHTRRSILDTIGVMVAGEAVGRGVSEVIDVVSADGGTAECTVIGRSAKLPLRAAVLANGATTHQLDFDDTHDRAVVHPTANSLPIALALGERIDADEEALVEAVTVGNEVACRLGVALTGLLFDHPWVRPPVLGMFGAVAAGARLLAMSSHEVSNAWGLLLPRTGGTLACLTEPGSWVRTMRDGFSADSAALALRLAQAGVKGERRAFDGKYGLFEAYFDGEFVPAAITEGLGESYAAADISLKPWPCCREVHGTLTALFDLLDELPDPRPEVAKVHLRVGHTNLEICEPGPVRRHPRHATDALCNLPFNVAVGAAYGRIPLSTYTPDGLADPRVAAMAERVTWEYDETQDRSGSLEPGAVRIELSDGTVRENVAELGRGHPDRPLTSQQRRDKFADCFAISGALDVAAGQRMVALLDAGDPSTPVRRITEQLRPAS